MSQLGAAKTQLRNILPAYFVTPVVRTPITKTTSNISGDETLTEGSTALVSVYIVRKNRPWFLDKAGLIEGGDALMLTQYNQAISKDDKITWNGNNYRVQYVLDRDQLTGEIAYKACNLFLI